MRYAFTFGCGLVTGLAVAFSSWVYFTVEGRVSAVEQGSDEMAANINKHTTELVGNINKHDEQVNQRLTAVQSGTMYSHQQVSELWKKIGEMEKRNRDLAGVK